jgi:2-iminobutanoate/2-iminopropanoate deaminase
MTRNIIATDKAPKAIGPYNQGVRFSGELIFTAGQIPTDPQTGAIVGTTMAEQTEQALKNLSAVLEAGGSSFKNVIKVTVFLKNMNDFAAMNDVYARYFTSEPPARSAVEVARLPKDVLVEIECLALVG